MKENLEKIKNVEKEKYYLNQEIHMKENLEIINLTDMDIINGLKINMNIKVII
jgi:hypothetical protein